MKAKRQKIEQVKKEIGEAIRRLRQERKSTGPSVAASAGYDKGNLSRLEDGKGNPELDTFLSIIIDGLNMEWPEFCRYWVADEGLRLKEEREARILFERLIREGHATREEIILLLQRLDRGAS